MGDLVPHLPFVEITPCHGFALGEPGRGLKRR
jgi:hypothetical protein